MAKKLQRPPRENVTPLVLEKVVWAGANLGSYRQAATAISELTSIKLAPKQVQRITNQTGEDWFGLSFAETQARFRPNLVVEGGGPFWEDRLYAEPGSVVTFRIGDVLLFGTNCCARCAVPGRDTLTGETTPDFVKRFTAARRDHLPPWACQEVFDHYYRLMVNTRLYAPADGGSIHVGDLIEILS